MVRYIVLQYRDELLAAQQAEIAAQARVGPARETWNREKPIRRHSSSRRMIMEKAVFSEEEKDQVASDLLIILQKIPMQVIGQSILNYCEGTDADGYCLAVNGLSLVTKVRFVASTLLDALSSPQVNASPASPETTRASQRLIRAQNYLCEFC